jgi:hypothetical protein
MPRTRLFIGYGICGSLQTFASGFTCLARLPKLTSPSTSRCDSQRVYLLQSQSADLYLGHRGRMPQPRLQFAGRHRPGSPKARFIPPRPHVCSHRFDIVLAKRLTWRLSRQDVLDNQARKQYLIHDPSQNPFGDAEIPLRFQSFDVFTKVRSMQLLVGRSY